jgi:protein O-GlcNAc transferase
LLGAGLQGRIGDAAGHLAALQAAYAAGGDPLSRLASSIAMTALYHDGLTPTEVAELHRSLCAPIEAAVRQQTDAVRTVDAGPADLADLADPAAPSGRRLRVGLVTGDLHRQHPVNLFMLPVLQRLDAARIELCVYHTGTMHDAYTRQAQACAARWVEAAALDDAALRQTIVADGVQVLIDLGGHTATHRLGVFALRAAPVQATFLGYPHSTGLSTIDWLIGDPVVSPAAHGHLFSEGIAQLPGSVFCWAPVDDYPLPAPRQPGAALVFGSFNNAMKLTPRTVALWARVLHAVPGAQLLLKAPSLADTEVQSRFAGLFAARGIAPERLRFRGPSGLAEMMQDYGEVDIALDPVPYNGGTTTLQALWMGVPVVALAGGNFVSRMGASFMAALGRPDWVAVDDDSYVAAAVALAQTRVALRGGRPALRARMAASALCDIGAYVANFEALLRRMWDQHHAGDSRRLLAARAPVVS